MGGEREEREGGKGGRRGGRKEGMERMSIRSTEWYTEAEEASDTKVIHVRTYVHLRYAVDFGMLHAYARTHTCMHAHLQHLYTKNKEMGWMLQLVA